MNKNILRNCSSSVLALCLPYSL